MVGRATRYHTCSRHVSSSSDAVACIVALAWATQARHLLLQSVPGPSVLRQQTTASREGSGVNCLCMCSALICNDKGSLSTHVTGELQAHAAAVLATACTRHVEKGIRACAPLTAEHVPAAAHNPAPALLQMPANSPLKHTKRKRIHRRQSHTTAPVAHMYSCRVRTCRKLQPETLCALAEISADAMNLSMLTAAQTPNM